MEVVSFLSGFGFGGLLFTSGLAIGLWLSRGRGVPHLAHRLAAEHAHGLVHALFRFTHRFAGDVHQCRSAMEDIGQELHAATLADDQPASLPLTLGSVELLRRLADANERLHRKLRTAESTLQQQADEIATYLTEARTDPLTGLPNRRAFEDHFAQHFARWSGQRTPLSLLILDIDRFKVVNDRYGHQAGDAVLEEVGRKVELVKADAQLVARYGGEEFALVLPDVDIDGGCRTAERARLAVAEQGIAVDDQRLRVTVSCGLATAQEGDDPGSLIKRADAALYAAKAAGRNRTFLHDGRRCRPVASRPDAAARLVDTDRAGGPDGADPLAAAPPADDVPASRFSQVCEELRRRMLEVLAEQDAPAAR